MANVKIINSEPMVSSVHSAVILGKSHCDTKKKIREVMEEQGSNEGVIESTFTITKTNKTYPQYYIDFKRFDLVADKFPFIKFDKTKYIQEFNETIERNMKSQVSNVLADEPVESNEIKNEIEGEIKEMTNEMKVFNFKENEVRTVVKDGEPGYRDWETDRKSTRLNSSHRSLSRMPSSA